MRPAVLESIARPRCRGSMADSLSVRQPGRASDGTCSRSVGDCPRAAAGRRGVHEPCRLV